MTQQYHALLANIRHLESQAQREPNSVSVLAVSKGQSIDKISTLHDAGQQSFGENYVDEAITKISALASKKIDWHFIGTIQSRRCKEIAEHFNWVHSICRAKELEKLGAARPKTLAPLNVCLQVNIDNSANKHGLRLEDIEPLANQVAKTPSLCLRGLMIFPDFYPDPQTQREIFRRAKSLFDDLKMNHPKIDTLSMGMSQDYESAVLEGSTLVRVGQLLFGPRSNHNQEG